MQKSLAEGFGLTVAEGMWKRRPVIGSAVGGIQDQVVEGTGVLLRDPADLAGSGPRCGSYSTIRAMPSRMGKAGQEHIREHFVGDRHLLQWAQLISATMSD